MSRPHAFIFKADLFRNVISYLMFLLQNSYFTISSDLFQMATLRGKTVSPSIIYMHSIIYHYVYVFFSTVETSK